MANRVLLAFDDLLTRPTTVRRVTQGFVGGSGSPADGWFTDDLGVGTYIPSGVTVMEIEFRRRVQLGVFGVLNFRVARLEIPDDAALSIAEVGIDAFDGATLVGSQSLIAQALPASPLDLDEYWVPASPLTVSRLTLTITAPLFGTSTHGAFIGRLFAAPALSFAGFADGGLDTGWTLAPADPTEAPIGITGAARPQPSVTGRRLSFTVGGVTDAGALNATQVDRFGLPTVEPAAALADLQARIGASRPMLALLRPDASDANQRRRLAAFGPLAEPFAITQAAGSSRWSARLTVQETQR